MKTDGSIDAARAKASHAAAAAGAKAYGGKVPPAKEAEALFAFGVEHLWPGAESFARQAAENRRKPFDADRWAKDDNQSERIYYGLFSAIGEMLAQIEWDHPPKKTARKPAKKSVKKAAKKAAK